MSRLTSSSDRFGSGRVRVVIAALAALVIPMVGLVPTALSATATPQRIDLRVLVLEDGSPWVDGIAAQLAAEGVPYTAISVAAAGRPSITPASLAAGDHAFYQAVIAPDANLGVNLTAAEVAAVRSYEAQFGIREVDAYNWANPAIGLNYAGFSGDLAGSSATVTDAGKANGFGYLNGPVPYSTGSYAFLSQPLTATSSPPMPPGASFTTLVSGVSPPSVSPAVSGSVIGVYTNAGVEQMVITSAFNFFQPQYKLVAHGIITWATRGVHLGYNRNYLTFHVDDAFSEDVTWNSANHCTPGEDCPRNPDGTSILPEQPVRMTADDVAFAVQWEAAHNYTLTLAFNGFYSAATDPLTVAFQANAGSFKWLNHGFEHIYQGCVQDFTVIPWRCQTDPATGAVQWVSQQAIYNEIQNNIATGVGLGLPFDATEYLSGEHSGLARAPQQPQDNPNFGAALTQAGIHVIGADASREPTQRQVGTALTVPRHPTAIYYNAPTAAQEVSEYNWLYTSRANGGGGNCEDNPATTTCITPLQSPGGFASYIVPTDAAYDLSFILSNDPRPFYAHVSNMTSERDLYPLLESILNTYRAGFAPSAPVVNLTETDAAGVLQRQSAWATGGMSATPAASAYLQDGNVTVTTDGSTAVPLTVPQGTTVAGVTLESYGGELSGWLPASTTATLPPSTLTLTGSTTFVVGQSNTITVSGTGNPAATLGLTGTLPTGVTFTPGTGTTTITGTPAPGTAGSYPITVTSTSGTARLQEQVTLIVQAPPAITSAASAAAVVGTAFTFTVTSTGSPTATLSSTGALPAGITFTPNADGTATLAGTAQANTAGSYPLTFTATNPAGATTQAFTLAVTQLPSFTSAATATAAAGSPFTFTVTTAGSPTSTVSVTGSLPAGITFTSNADGTATLAGTPTGAASSSPLTFTATNSAGATTQAFTLIVTAQGPAITSAATATAVVGTAFSFTVTATGSPVPTITRTGTLPAGITFTANSNGTGTLAGTPAAATAGTYAESFQAQNSTDSVTQAFTLTVNPGTTGPTVTAIAPAVGPATGATVVTVTGTNLTGGTVKFGTVAATAVTCTASSCTATSPAGTGIVDVRVTTSTGTSPVVTADRFTYQAAPPGPNLVPNPGFETGGVPADNWGGPLARSGSVVHAGAFALAETTRASSGGWDLDSNSAWYAPVSPAKLYTASIWVRATKTTTVLLNIDLLTSAGGYSDSATGTAVVLTANTWTRLTVTFTPVTGQVFAAFEPNFSGTTAGTVITWDDMSINTP